jgi:hypothetical protein
MNGFSAKYIIKMCEKFDSQVELTPQKVYRCLSVYGIRLKDYRDGNNDEAAAVTRRLKLSRTRAKITPRKSRKAS